MKDQKYFTVSFIRYHEVFADLSFILRYYGSYKILKAAYNLNNSTIQNLHFFGSISWAAMLGLRGKALKSQSPAENVPGFCWFGASLKLLQIFEVLVVQRLSPVIAPGKTDMTSRRTLLAQLTILQASKGNRAQHLGQIVIFKINLSTISN